MSSSSSRAAESSPTPLPWELLFQRITTECDAMRAEVLETQQRVHDELLPRLEQVNASCDACDVTLRGILTALRRSTGEPSFISAGSTLTEETPHETRLSGSTNNVEAGADAGSSRTSSSFSSSSIAQRVERLEEQLAALTRNQEIQRRAYNRERQRQMRELDQVRRGVVQMGRCKDQLLVVLRQLQLDKVALLRACSPAGERYSPDSPSPPQQIAARRASLSERDMQPIDSGRLDVNAATLESLETTVKGFELLMAQERAAREAQVQELVSALSRLEPLQAARERNGNVMAHVSSDALRMRRTSDGGAAIQAGESVAANGATCASPSALRNGAERDTSRRLRYPTEVVVSPASTLGALNLADPESHLTDRENEKRSKTRGKSASPTHDAVVLRDRLLRFYALYDPRMIPAVAEVVRQFKGPPEELLAALEMDYDAYGYFSRD
ncbi:hypothetical protein ABB37_04454 [Leptomonas pyrrhocoris]|uniref:Uncharacterized protein n=1 Tax=Leptomonas pyrrhocoris TaxID=157538 RepID=A0A0M9G2V3_LEPPY|nr:hypothetical protein ABB37_04454 [Leptomonas pyrrhocoris]KPA81097.1 hypothetical protein ABB37_04454 [Leptomonas pyrrhocoris]|eukprot:XP_015659536.1 hypothetical protein ABB37_04454 [Leptomonas pyrrhocoris]